VILLNSDSWSNLNSFVGQNNNNNNKNEMTSPSQSSGSPNTLGVSRSSWDGLRNRKTQQDQIERELQEMELLKQQQIKQKEEEDAMKIRDELERLKREAQVSMTDRKNFEEIERRRLLTERIAAERLKRQQELEASNTGSVNLMSQFDIMRSFETGRFG
jgi:hypothetical protein